MIVFGVLELGVSWTPSTSGWCPHCAPSLRPTAGGELSERLEAERQLNGRVAQTLTVAFSTTLPWESTPQGGVAAAAGQRQKGRARGGM